MNKPLRQSIADQIAIDSQLRERPVWMPQVVWSAILRNVVCVQVIETFYCNKEPRSVTRSRPCVVPRKAPAWMPRTLWRSIVKVFIK